MFSDRRSQLKDSKKTIDRRRSVRRLFPSRLCAHHSFRSGSSSSSLSLSFSLFLCSSLFCFSGVDSWFFESRSAARRTPVDGGWTEWSEFTPCSITCGTGFQRRGRTCTQPKPTNGGKFCPGRSSDYRRCRPGACRDDRNYAANEVESGDVCSRDITKCVAVKCPNGEKEIVLKQTTGSRNAGCCESQLYNMTREFCEDDKLRGCSFKTDFRCSNGNCAPKSSICDGVNDCSDGSDELGCGRGALNEGLHCRNDQFKCLTTDQCISSDKVCDGHRHCGDGTDELSCARGMGAWCGVSQFRCSADDSCIAKSKLCDGESDCGDGADESGCRRHCFTSEQKCVDVRCPDKFGRSSAKLTYNIPLQVNTSNWGCCQDEGLYNRRTHVCQSTGIQNCGALSSTLRCANGNCVAAGWRCDDENDCGDGSDELDCGRCGEEEFRCPRTSQCVTRTKVCDGRVDCVGTGADEFGCVTVDGLWCDRKDFRCRKGGCVDGDKVCDGRNDCADKSDEVGCGFRRDDRITTARTTTTTTTTTTRAPITTTMTSTTTPKPNPTNVDPEIARKAEKVLPTFCGLRPLRSFPAVHRPSLRRPSSSSSSSSSSPRLSASILSNILGGSEAPRGAWPWQAQLWTVHLKGYCGASIINSRWILTAAHCVYIHNSIVHVSITNYKQLRQYLLKELFVKMGVTDTEADEKTETVRRIEEIYVHPKYQDYKPNHVDHEYDLALIKLSFGVDVDDPADGIFPVCLSTTPFKSTRPREEPTSGWVAGWGTRREGRLETVTRLRHVRLPLVDRDTCRRALSMPKPARPVADHMFCAGFERGGADACQGDSGGAFVVKNGDVWTQTGVVSWGRGCGRPGKYGVMIDAGFFYDWIVETVYDNS